MVPFNGFLSAVSTQELHGKGHSLTHYEALGCECVSLSDQLREHGPHPSVIVDRLAGGLALSWNVSSQ